VIAFLARRLLLMIPTLVVIGTLTFVLVRLAPGGPFQSEKDIPAKAKEQLMHRYGLDRPLWSQYASFLGNAARMDFGPSYRYPDRQVRDLILEGFAVSAEMHQACSQRVVVLRRWIQTNRILKFLECCRKLL